MRWRIMKDSREKYNALNLPLSEKKAFDKAYEFKAWGTNISSQTGRAGPKGKVEANWDISHFSSVMRICYKEGIAETHWFVCASLHASSWVHECFPSYLPLHRKVSRRKASAFASSHPWWDSYSLFAAPFGAKQYQVASVDPDKCNWCLFVGRWQSIHVNFQRILQKSFLDLEKSEVSSVS